MSHIGWRTRSILQLCVLLAVESGVAAKKAPAHHGFLPPPVKALIGTQKHPSPLVRPDIVEPWPSKKERSAWTTYEKEQRYTFWGYWIGGAVFVTSMILEAITWAATASRNNGYVQVSPTETAALNRADSLKSGGTGDLDSSHVGSGYSKADVFFVWYKTSFEYCCAGLVVYAVVNGYIDSTCGMDFEVYMPWLAEALLAHCISGIWRAYYFAKNPAANDTLKSPSKIVCMTVLPFWSDRWNCLRDWITIGIYVQHGTWVSYGCSAVVAISTMLVLWKTLEKPQLLRNVRQIFWPLSLLKPPDPLSVHDYSSAASAASTPLNDQDKELLLLLERKCRREESPSPMWINILTVMDKVTREHKRINSVYGEVPQGIAAAVFVLFAKYSRFVFLCGFLYIGKALVQFYLRPWALSWLANTDTLWCQVTASDLRSLLKSRDCYTNFLLPFFPRGSDWRARAIIAMIIITQWEEDEPALAAAIEGLGNLYESEEAEDDSYGEEKNGIVNFMVSRYQTFQLSPELGDSYNVAVMKLCPGLKPEDIKTPLPKSGGNLAYVPFGSFNAQAKKLVKDMMTGCWEPERWQKELNCPFATKADVADGEDLMVCITDLEPDDSMAIAQLWQWNKEQFNMQNEPFVIFAADFADKDTGNVFEKKVLMTQLMLGIRKFSILTPNPTACELSGKSGADHPAAAYWEGKYKVELDKVCERIASFCKNPSSKRIHLYIMAPGRGNIEAIFDKLKSDSATWTNIKNKDFQVSLYSGSFNIRGMKGKDLETIRELVKLSEAQPNGQPLLDAAKFPFFGFKDHHKLADSFTTFAPDSFASQLNLSGHPLLISFLKLLNDEHNMGLLKPEKLYKNPPLNAIEERRFSKIKPKFNEEQLQEYCGLIAKDFVLYAKVPGFKKSVLTSFAFGCCDSPLCDQLIFLIQWYKKNKPDALTTTSRGKWEVSDNFTSVKVDGATKQDAGATQPTLLEPLNEQVLNAGREALQEYLIKHLDCLVHTDN